MTKEKQIIFIKEEITTAIDALNKKNTNNDQLIEELDKLLNLSKYGSVNHVNKVVKLSTLRNYKLRLNEVVEALKQVTDLQNIETLKTYIDSIIEDSKKNLKISTDSLNTVEVFSNEYIKNEILVKTYSELTSLYTEVVNMLEKIKEEATKVTPVTPVTPVVEPVKPEPVKPVKKTTNKKVVE